MIARSDADWFVGIDLHEDTLTACVLCGRDREVSYAKVACTCRDRIRSFFASLPQPRVVAIETVGFERWPWTDPEPLAWAPPENVQVLRNWTTHRNGLARQHATVRHCEKSTLNRPCGTRPRRSDPASVNGHRSSPTRSHGTGACLRDPEELHGPTRAPELQSAGDDLRAWF